MEYMLANLIVRRQSEQMLASLDPRAPARPERSRRRRFLERRYRRAKASASSA